MTGVCSDLMLVLSRDKVLAGVKLNKADIDLVATELEIDHKVAERRLREHKGYVVTTLESFL